MNGDRSHEINGFSVKKRKAKSWLHPVEPITNTGDTDYLAHLVNTPAQIVSEVHNLEQVTCCNGLSVILNETEYICFKRAAISSLNVKPLKSMNQFTSFGSNILSTEIDVSIRLEKAWTAINFLSIIWKAYLYDDIKQDFSKLVLSL